MADVKISQLPVATTPVTGTEVLPIVQSSITAKVSIDNLTAGRAVSMASATVSTGNLAFTGTAQRITGDFSNATIASRVAFQTSTANSATAVNAIPSGTGTVAQFIAHNAADLGNASRAGVNCSGTLATFFSDLQGTGTYLPMVFNTGGSERVRIDTSGNVGIGTSSPGTKLHVAAAANSGVLVSSTDGTTFKGIAFNTSDNQFTVGTQTNHPVVFFSNNAERARIDTSGNVGIGTSSPAVKLDVNGITGWSGSTTGQTAQIVGASSGINGGGNFRVLSSTTQAVDVGGALTFGGYYTSTTASVDFGAILGAKENSTGGNTAGYLSFGTRPNAGNMTERARIDSSGNLLVGTTTATTTPTQGLVIGQNTNAVAMYLGHASGVITGSFYIGFNYSGSTIGSITQSGTTAVLYNVTSDQRLKENVQDAASASSLIDAIQVRQYDWKSDGSHQRYGFVAQELVTVAPEAVHQPADPEEMMAVDYSKLVPMLVKEIQSLRARVAALESN